MRDLVILFIHLIATFAQLLASGSGNIEGVSGPAAQCRPGTHEWIVWEGEAADKAKLCAS